MEGSVLVLDDERAFTEIIAAILRDAGLEVHAFSDPRQALRTVRGKGLRLDVALVDQRMPFCSGSEFLGRLRVMSPEVLGILVTGYTDPEDYVGSQRMLFDYILKPFSNQDLLFRIFRALFSRALSKEARSVSVLALEHAPYGLSAAHVQLARTAMRQCDVVVVSGGDEPGAWPYDAVAGHLKGAGRLVFCHQDFLSERAQRALRDLLAEASPAPYVVRVGWRSWRDFVVALGRLREETTKVAAGPRASRGGRT